jgi:tetraacyldisaccharide 4'-kinase
MYAWLTDLRNWLYNNNFLKTKYFDDAYVVSIGNLAMGGTGKTPMVEYLLYLIEENFSTIPKIVISRGYKRHTKGFRIATSQDTPQSIGDEPFQVFQKFGQSTKIIVHTNRVDALQRLLSDKLLPSKSLVLLDDAFQHRAIGRNLDIVLTDYHHLFYEDRVLPFGKLRERPNNLQRADCLIVSKCPDDLSAERKSEITTLVQKIVGTDYPIFFSKIQYSFHLQNEGKIHLQPNILLSQVPLILVSGIGNVSSLEKITHQNLNITKHLRFKDHHEYSESDEQMIENILAQTQAQGLVTTQKDWTKLSTLIPTHIPVWVLEMRFCFDTDDFNQWFCSKIGKFAS